MREKERIYLSDEGVVKSSEIGQATDNGRDEGSESRKGKRRETYSERLSRKRGRGDKYLVNV